jgi:hypothetical protein
MPLVFNRTLTTLLILFGSILVANAQSGVTQQSTINPGSGWTFIQDNPAFFCAGNVTSCTISVGNITPTVAGSVWILEVQTPNATTMTNVTGGGGTWVHCPKCAVRNPSGYSGDAWYNLSGNAGTFQGINFTLSASSGSFVSVNFIELLPPPGTTASYDDSGNAAPTGCTTCTAVGGLNITGTDAIWQDPGGASQLKFNSWSAPYITTANGSGIALNTTSGAAPTSTYTGPSNPEFMAIAFKSSAGVFTPSVSRYSLVNYTAPATNPFSSSGVTCNPSCNLTIPSMGTGNLVYLEIANENGQFISSVTGGGTWIVPASCQGKATLMGQNMAQSCAYALSSTPGTTSLHVTMSGSGTNNFFAAYEIASTVGGSFALDTGATRINTQAGQYYQSGPTLTLTGSDDVIFSAAICVGGSTGPNYYPQPYNQQSLNYYFFNEAATAISLDSGPTPSTPIWANPQANNQQPGMIISGMAFTAIGGSSTAPNPPTGLTVTVQ